MSNVEHLFENALAALELNRTKEQWLNANELNLEGVSNEALEVIWDLAIYTKYTYDPSLKAIPVEWVEKYIDNRLIKYGDTWTFINSMINEWEKKNG